MKATQLFEDRADDWLAKYTLENLDKWPSAEIRAALSKRYPLDQDTVLYRGMNFKTKEEWDTFVDNVKSGNNTIEFGRISSWAPDAGTAEAFALTRPTYFLNAELMAAETIRAKEREYLSGYRGIIIKMQATPNMNAIDVRKSVAAKEEEVILPAGTYTIVTHRVLKLFRDEVADTGVNETISKILDQMLALKNASKSNEYVTKFYEYIHHHFSDEIVNSVKFKEKVFNITIKKSLWNAKNLANIVSSSYWGGDKNLGGRHEAREVKISYNSSIFYLANKGMFPNKQLPMLTKYADIIVSAYQKEITKYSDEADVTFNLGGLELIKPYVSNKSLLDNLLKSQVGDKYNKINSTQSIKDINAIKDPAEKQRAIQQHMNDIQNTLGQFTKR